ncbi:MAG: hypothetical protein K2N26_06290 [Oscillospiraceae bacterium]|nr:hypothetical protein [Oscillospiraceae bacterium]
MKIKFFTVISLIVCLSAALCDCSADVTPLVGTWVRSDIEMIYTLNADKTSTKDENFGNYIQASGRYEYNGKSITFNETLSYDVRLEGSTMYWSIGSMEIELKKQ